MVPRLRAPAQRRDNGVFLLEKPPGQEEARPEYPAPRPVRSWARLAWKPRGRNSAGRTSVPQARKINNKQKKKKKKKKKKNKQKNTLTGQFPVELDEWGGHRMFTGYRRQHNLGARSGQKGGCWRTYRGWTSAEGRRRVRCGMDLGSGRSSGPFGRGRKGGVVWRPHRCPRGGEAGGGLTATATAPRDCRPDYGAGQRHSSARRETQGPQNHWPG